MYKVPPLEVLYALIDRCGVCLYRRVAFFAVPHGADVLRSDVVWLKARGKGDVFERVVGRYQVHVTR